MPPEQFGGYSAPTSDLYTLGATLIYLATGQHPDKLPQREMRLLFEDKVNLDAAFIQWLKWLTEPSIDLRHDQTVTQQEYYTSNHRVSIPVTYASSGQDTWQRCNRRWQLTESQALSQKVTRGPLAVDSHGNKLTLAQTPQLKRLYLQNLVQQNQLARIRLHMEIQRYNMIMCALKNMTARTTTVGCEPWQKSKP